MGEKERKSTFSPPKMDLCPAPSLAPKRHPGYVTGATLWVITKISIPEKRSDDGDNDELNLDAKKLHANGDREFLHVNYSSQFFKEVDLGSYLLLPLSVQRILV